MVMFVATIKARLRLITRLRLMLRLMLWPRLGQPWRGQHRLLLLSVLPPSQPLWPAQEQGHSRSLSSPRVRVMVRVRIGLILRPQ